MKMRIVVKLEDNHYLLPEKVTLEQFLIVVEGLRAVESSKYDSSLKVRGEASYELRVVPEGELALPKLTAPPPNGAAKVEAALAELEKIVSDFENECPPQVKRAIQNLDAARHPEESEVKATEVPF
jgi:hypothetical protein